MDRIVVKGMEFYGRHGVLAAERELGQRFRVDVEMRLDLQPAGVSDDLRLTVDYSLVYKLVEKVITGQPRQLLETLAEQIAGEILAGFPVQEVGVTVHKPQAPLGGSFTDVAVEVQRRRLE